MTRRPRKARPLRKRPSRKPASAAKPKGREPLDASIAAGAHALGLNIRPAWMPAVRSHLDVTLRHGARVADFAPPDDAEPAPVFEA